MTPAYSPLEARLLDLAERVLAAHGYVVVSPFIAALIDRLEADPTAITDEELQAIRYCIAVGTDGETGGRVKSLTAEGLRTGWGGFCNRALPPFVPHQKGLS